MKLVRSLLRYGQPACKVNFHCCELTRRLLLLKEDGGLGGGEDGLAVGGGRGRRSGVGRVARVGCGCSRRHRGASRLEHLTGGATDDTEHCSGFER